MICLFYCWLFLKIKYSVCVSLPSSVAYFVFFPSAQVSATQQHLLLSAATDNCIKLWDLRVAGAAACVRRFEGHTNRQGPIGKTPPLPSSPLLASPRLSCPHFSSFFFLFSLLFVGPLYSSLSYSATCTRHQQHQSQGYPPCIGIYIAPPHFCFISLARACACAGCDFSPCLRYLGTGSEDKSAYLFDLRRGDVVARLGGGHTDVVSDVAFNPAHAQWVTACYDNKLRFFADQ